MGRLDLGIVFPTIKARFGGERLVLETARQLAAWADVTLYVPGIAPGMAPPGVGVVELGRLRAGHARQTIGDWLSMPRLARRTRRHALFLGVGVQGAWGGALAARRHRRPFVYLCLEPPRIAHDLKGLQARQPALVRWSAPALARVDRWAVSRATRVLAISEWTRDQVKAIYGCDATVIHPGIDLAPLRAVPREAARRRLGIAPGTRLFLSLSKLHARKRIGSCIPVFQEMARGVPDACFAIVGDGPERASLERLVVATGDARIRLMGYASEEQRVDWLRSADVFLFNAQDEPFGLAPLEAKGLGLPVLPLCPPYPIRSPEEAARELHQALLAVAEAWP
jgi:glycosyltransferase involved in cell wall biosynthesis